MLRLGIDVRHSNCTDDEARSGASERRGGMDLVADHNKIEDDHDREQHAERAACLHEAHCPSDDKAKRAADEQTANDLREQQYLNAQPINSLAVDQELDDGEDDDEDVDTEVAEEGEQQHDEEGEGAGAAQVCATSFSLIFIVLV